MTIGKLGLASLAFVCTGQRVRWRGADESNSPTGGLPVPLPTGDVSGRIESLETAADLITYNQTVNVGLSIPVEGAIQRSTGIITRWELPIPVHVDSSISGNCVEEALDYWQSVTGLPFVLLGTDADPRVLVRAATSDELNIAAGLGLVYRTYPTIEHGWGW